jgi:hypothetical protein
VSEALAMPKVKWKAKRSTLPETLICNQAEAIELLRRQTFDDAVKHGWLAPVSQAGEGGSLIYSVADVQYVAKRIVAGFYPGVKGKVEVKRGGRQAA